MITAKSSGSFKKTTEFLRTMEDGDIFRVLDHYGRIGVDLLSSATPRDTGRAASSWSYEVTHQNGRHTIHWSNDNVEGGVNVAIILQYGHGTGTGGWVEGRDYINPATRVLFDKILDDIWGQVRNA